MTLKTDTKTLYVLNEVDTSRTIPIYIMQSIGFTHKNAIIKYESIDEDGAEVINAGILIQDIPITMMLIGNLTENFAIIKKLKDTKNPFTLFTNIDTSNIFGTYVIESISGNITDGADSIMLNVNLVEYKKSLLRQRNFTLAESKNLDNLLNFLKNQNIIDKR